MGKGTKSSSAPKSAVRPHQRVTLSKKTRSEISGSFRYTAKRATVISPSALPKAAAVCPECGAVRYEKRWRSAATLPKGLRTSDLPRTLCDECRAGAKVSGGKAVGWAGELVVEGVSDPEVMKEVVGLIKNVGDRAARRDPEDRIIDLAVSGRTVKVYTTENQLAVSIGKQLDRARKGGRLEIKWSSDDKVARVRWQAGE